MKWLLITIFFFICTSTVSALNKYVDSTGGNDANNGNSPGTAYKSITKVNSIMASLSNGDSILFIRGQFWHDQIRISHNSIHFGAYGSGSQPLISALTTVTGFTLTATSNVYQSAVITGSNTGISMVTIDDIARAMGRWPDAGTYASYNTLNSLTAITSNTSMPFDFTGATLCMRKIADILGREMVTSVSGSTINHVNLTGTNYKGFNGFGYFIEDALLTLTTQNEWYFNSSTRRLYVYSTTAPTNVKISTIDTLVIVGAFDNITFDNISFEGADKSGINIGRTGISTGIQIKNCNFNNMGRDAIYATSDQSLIVQNCYFNHIMNCGVQMSNQGGNSINPNVSYNVMKNIGYLQGMSYLDYNNGLKFAMEAITNGTSAVVGEIGLTAKFNSIDTVGHIGIRFFQNNCHIDTNYINYYCFITDDAGAINSFDNFTHTVETNRTIWSNIITNGIGAGLGAGGSPTVNALYSDDEADGESYKFNSIANVAQAAFNGSCMYVHNGTNIDVLNNTFYNGGYSGIAMVNDDHAPTIPLRNLNVQNNLVFARNNTSLFLVTRTYQNDIATIYNPINNNRYWRPTLITGNVIQTRVFYKDTTGKDKTNNYTLPLWQSTFSGAVHGAYDAASTQGGSNTGATDFVYNFTDHDSTLNFSGLSYIVPQYNSPYQIVYSNSMIMSPYTGYIRIANGSVAPVNKFPVANSGGNVSITLPINQTNLIGTGSDTDGVIVNYAWVQLSGPNTATITPSSSTTTGTTNVSGLIQGIYQFQLTVVDNNGATGTAISRVTVNAAIPNNPPTSNAGRDTTITQPSSVASAIGSGTNGSGTGRTYSWSQSSGPVTATIVSPTSATTNLTNLSAVGTYTFRLKVTNTPIGDTAIDFMQVFVLAQPFNQPPVVNAGTDSIITLPDNDIHLIGTATDPDGTIVSTTWDKFSGPATYTITSPSSLSTTVTNMVQGVYEFRLIGVDNQGKSDTDFVIITVNSAIPPPNAPPTVSYISLDQTITAPTSSVVDTVRGADTDGTIIAWKWIQISGPMTATISNPNDSVTTVSNLTVPGTYIMQGRVYDDDGDSAFKNTKITVNPLPNTLPNSLAGNDTTIVSPAAIAHVNGSASNDPGGSITAYNWRQLSGPNTATIVSTNSAQTDINGLIQGAYIFQLWVQGSGGASDTAVDAMQVTVSPPVILTPPTANVNPINPITLPVNSATLSGSGTNGSGTIISHVWTFISGPSGGDISTPNNYTTLVSNMVEGTYTYQLEVIDDNDLHGTALVQVIVRPVVILQSVLLRGYRFP